MREIKNKKSYSVLLLSACVIIGVLCLIIGTSYARYREILQGELSFKIETPKKTEIKLGELITDESDSSRKRMEVSIKNSNEGIGFGLSLQVATTFGIYTDQATLAIVYTEDDGNEIIYKGQPEIISKESTRYKELEEGMIYRFYDEEGKELMWQIGSGQEKEFVLEITGQKTISAIEMIAITTQIAEA